MRNAPAEDPQEPEANHQPWALGARFFAGDRAGFGVEDTARAARHNAMGLGPSLDKAQVKGRAAKADLHDRLFAVGTAPVAGDDLGATKACRARRTPSGLVTDDAGAGTDGTTQ